jgi:hypothetical protein
MASRRGWAAAGVIGPILFVAGFTWLGATRAGYDPMRHFVSLLSLTEDGWPQTVSFIVSGLLLVAAAAGLRAALVDGPGCRVIPTAVAISGGALIVAGLVPTDPVQGYPPGTPLEMPVTASPAAIVHVTAALFLFAALALAALVGARRFQSRRRSIWAVYSLLTGIVVLAANAATTTAPGAISPVAAIAGLLQRVALIAGLGWIAAFSLRTLGTRDD